MRDLRWQEIWEAAVKLGGLETAPEPPAHQGPEEVPLFSEMPADINCTPRGFKQNLTQTNQLSLTQKGTLIMWTKN